MLQPSILCHSSPAYKPQVLFSAYCEADCSISKRLVATGDTLMVPRWGNLHLKASTFRFFLPPLPNIFSEDTKTVLCCLIRVYLSVWVQRHASASSPHLPIPDNRGKFQPLLRPVLNKHTCNVRTRAHTHSHTVTYINVWFPHVHFVRRWKERWKGILITNFMPHPFHIYLSLDPYCNFGWGDIYILIFRY